jgi:molybdopterin-guanine dinucleotide biosynthesis protein A
MGDQVTVTGAILAGGRGRRMGGRDKGLVDLGGRPMIAHVIERIRPQVDTLIINANRHVERYGEYGYPVVADVIDDYCGPLAGMASVLRNAAPGLVVTVPCDTPFLPLDLVQRLHGALRTTASELAVVDSGERLQPVFALLHTDLLDSLMEFLTAGGRKIDAWYESHVMTRVDFSSAAEAFANINTPEQAAEVERQLGHGQA